MRVAVHFVGLVSLMGLLGASAAYSVPPDGLLEQVIHNQGSLFTPLNPATQACSSSGSQGSQANSPDFCEDPYEAICKAPLKIASDLTEAQVRKEALAKVAASLQLPDVLEKLHSSLDALAKVPPSLSDLIEENPKSPERVQVVKYYSSIIHGVYDHILEKFKAKGITEKMLQDRVAQIRENLAQRVERSPQFKTQDPKDTYSASELAKKIRAIQFITPHDLRPGSDSSFKMTKLFHGECGVDGLLPGASYIKRSNQVVICPGKLLEVLQSSSLEGMTWVIGHEMGHSIDAHTPSTDSGLPLLDRYRSFLSCVDKNYSKEMATLPEVQKYLMSERIPSFQAKLASLMKEGNPDKDQIFKVKRRIEMNELWATQIPFLHTHFRQTFSSEPTAVQCHSGELCADHFGIEAIGDLIENYTKESTQKQSNSGDIQRGRRALFASQVVSLCERDGENDRSALGDGVHPSMRFRVQYALKNPRIRTLLGCGAPRPGEKPWCSLSGEVHSESQGGH